MVGDVPDVITQDCSQKCEIGGWANDKSGGAAGRAPKARESRGAEDRGAEGGWVWRGGVPLPNGGRFWGGDCALTPENTPSPEFFKNLCLGMLHFGCNLMHFQT